MASVDCLSVEVVSRGRPGKGNFAQRNRRIVHIAGLVENLVGRASYDSRISPSTQTSPLHWQLGKEVVRIVCAVPLSARSSDSS
jgi:hypothetical protein